MQITPRDTRGSVNSVAGDIGQQLRSSFVGSAKSAKALAYITSLSNVVSETQKLLAEVLLGCCLHVMLCWYMSCGRYGIAL